MATEFWIAFLQIVYHHTIRGNRNGPRRGTGETGPWAGARPASHRTHRRNGGRHRDLKDLGHDLDNPAPSKRAERRCLPSIGHRRPGRAGARRRAEGGKLFHQIGALAAGNTLYAVDMPGHGESPRLDRAQPSLADFTERLGGFVEDVVGGPAILVGHSMGAMVAIDFASRYPDLCRGVAALNAIYRRASESRTAVLERAASIRLNAAAAQDIATAPVRRWFGENPAGHDRDMAELCRSWLVEADREGYAAAYSIFASEDGPSNDLLASLAVPAIFLTGEHDGNSTPSMAQAMARLAPHGRAVVIRGARHLAQLTHPGEVNAALLEFFASCGRMPAGLRRTGAAGA